MGSINSCIWHNNMPLIPLLSANVYHLNQDFKYVFRIKFKFPRGRLLCDPHFFSNFRTVALLIRVILIEILAVYVMESLIRDLAINFMSVSKLYLLQVKLISNHKFTYYFVILRSTVAELNYMIIVFLL